MKYQLRIPELPVFNQLVQDYTKLALRSEEDMLYTCPRIINHLKLILGHTVQGLPVSHLAWSLVPLGLVMSGVVKQPFGFT